MNEQNDGLKSFLELSEHGRELEFGIRSPRRGVIDVMTYADARGVLEVAGPWRMSPAEARRMEDALGWTPSGGWAALVALLCGTGALVATHHGFYAKQTIAAWQERTDDEVRLALGEAFTRFLVPPTPMAGLCVSLGVHPYWGLRVAKAQGGAGDDTFLEEHAQKLFPPEHLEIAETTVFGAIAGVFAGLAALPSGHAYPVDALTEFARCCLQTAWTMGRDMWDPSADAYPMFESSGPRWNDPGALDVFLSDLLDHVLVPAGLASRVEVGRFVLHDTIRSVPVGSFSSDETTGWLGWVTATEPRFLVA